MLEVNNLTIKTTDRTLVENINFKIKENLSLGIIGESGSGKSTTVLALMGLLNPEIYSISGSIKLYGKEILNISEKLFSKIRLSEIAMIYQNPFNTFSPVEKINNQIDRIYKIKKRERNDKKIINLLKLAELNENHLKKYPHELSGGELQRLVIVTSLLLDPKILICDEPTTSLDKSTEVKILEILNTFREKNGLSLIFITHDLNIIEKISDDLIIMKNGKIIEKGKTAQIIKYPEQKYSRELLSFLNWEIEC